MKKPIAVIAALGLALAGALISTPAFADEPSTAADTTQTQEDTSSPDISTPAAQPIEAHSDTTGEEATPTPPTSEEETSGTPQSPGESDPPTEQTGSPDGTPLTATQWVAWAMPSYVNSETATWPQTYEATGQSTDTQSAADFNSTLKCGVPHQVDGYFVSETTASLISGGYLDGPNNPEEDLIPGGWGVAYFVFPATECPPVVTPPVVTPPVVTPPVVTPPVVTPPVVTPPVVTPPVVTPPVVTPPVVTPPVVTPPVVTPEPVLPASLAFTGTAQQDNRRHWALLNFGIALFLFGAATFTVAMVIKRRTDKKVGPRRPQQ